MKISIVVAVGENGVIGKDNDLIWHLPRDLSFFKKITSGHHILMGSNTFLALGKPLPKHTHLVISKSKSFDYQSVIMAETVEKGIEIAKSRAEDELFITGGGQVYKYCLDQNLVDKVYLSTVHQNFEGDTHFLGFDKTKWKLITSFFYEKDKKNAFDLSFEQYCRP